jgi:hypothetical protein
MPSEMMAANVNLRANFTDSNKKQWLLIGGHCFLLEATT